MSLISNIQTSSSTSSATQPIILPSYMNSLDPLIYEFGLKYLKSRVAKDNTTSFVAFPPNLYTFCLILNKGIKDTAQKIEMLRYLGIEQGQEEQIHTHFSFLMKQIENLAQIDNGLFEYKQGNIIFSPPKTLVSENYQRSIKKHYDCDIFNNSEDANQRVNQLTRGKITKIVEESSSTQLSISSCAYFAGKWVKAFDREETRNSKFECANGSRVEVPMMVKNETFPVYFGEKFNLIELHYKSPRGIQFTYVIVTSKDANYIPSLEELQTARKQTIEQKVILQLPKQKYDINEQILKSLIEGGLPKDLTLETVPSIVDEIELKAKGHVDEEGTEMAVVTTASARGMPLEPIFNAMRPFSFFVFANQVCSTGSPNSIYTTSTPLCMGIIKDAKHLEKPEVSSSITTSTSFNPLPPVWYSSTLDPTFFDENFFKMMLDEPILQTIRPISAFRDVLYSTVSSSGKKRRIGNTLTVINCTYHSIFFDKSRFLHVDGIKLSQATADDCTYVFLKYNQDIFLFDRDVGPGGKTTRSNISQALREKISQIVLQPSTSTQGVNSFFAELGFPGKRV